MDTVASLLDRARSGTGLEDFGGEGFREGLDRLVHALATEARLNATGTAAFEAQIVDYLSRRLEVEDWYARHPEIADGEIIAPLVGLGLPRTGSSALSCMLAADPTARSIRGWEAMAPAPVRNAAPAGPDPRLAQAERAMEVRNTRFPRMRTMLPSTATTPTECQTFMGYDFKSHIFQAMGQVPGYSRWLNEEADLVPTYTYVKRVLKLLQWQEPSARWRIKNPSHIVFIDAFDTVFPDARYVMTHRDIAKVIPSAADLAYEMNRAFSDDVDQPYLGRLAVETWELGMRRLIAFRDSGRDDRFFDIHFAEFQRDPYPMLERLYAWLGEPLTDEARAAMEAWRQGTPREKHGQHLYDPAEFGLSEAALRERFRFYSDRFDVLAAA